MKLQETSGINPQFFPVLTWERGLTFSDSSNFEHNLSQNVPANPCIFILDNKVEPLMRHGIFCHESVGVWKNFF